MAYILLIFKIIGYYVTKIVKNELIAPGLQDKSALNDQKRGYYGIFCRFVMRETTGVLGGNHLY